MNVCEPDQLDVETISYTYGNGMLQMLYLTNKLDKYKWSTVSKVVN